MPKKNPFVEHEQFETKPKRNSFDLSFQNNLSMKFGTLYPVLCKEVHAGDSFSIDSALQIKMFPMVFPVQTPIRATMHFFYVRNRNLWKNWMDFRYCNREDVVHPYIDSRNFPDVKTGSIYDYLGIPTTVNSNDVQEIAI